MAKAETRIIVADDHPIFRQGLKQVIEAEPGLTIVGEAADGETALGLLQDLKPDLAVLDINMPKRDGFEVVQKVRQKRWPIEIIFLTMHTEEAMFQRALSLDVKGYVVKDSAVTDIVNSIRAVIAGQNYTSPSVTTYLFKRANRSNAASSKVPSLADLTPTERRILGLIAEYKTSKEIADELCIHYRTVENYRTNICAKLDLHGSHALIKFALKHQSDLS
jgi:DNA-binding NarL/FixJ family response regulator